jgi:hypothetical protein
MANHETLRKRAQVNADKLRAEDQSFMRFIASTMVAKVRLCLGGCGLPFNSTHSGHRVCPACKADRLRFDMEE